MPTLQKIVTEYSWENLNTEFGFLPGEQYLIQNFGPSDLFLTEQITIPTTELNDTPRTRLYPGNSIKLFANAGQSIFARCNLNALATIYIQRIGGAKNIFALNRLFSDNGLLTGNKSQNIDGLTTPTEFYVEALSDERLAVARAVVHIHASTNIGVGEYGDIGDGLTNGIKIFYKVGGVKLDITDGFDVKINEDWGRWCYDSTPVSIGPTQNTPIWRVRWSFTKYALPDGIILEEGDQLGVIISDDLSDLIDHTIIAEGKHLGIPNPAWLIPIL